MMVQDAVVNGSSVFQVSFLPDFILEWGKWHRSKDRKSGENPFGSYLMNKKWTMVEEFNNHMMKFQQVTASTNYFSKLHYILYFRLD